MEYRVELTTRATRDLDHLYEQIEAAESIPAHRWFKGLEQAIDSLERLPRRCPVIPEMKQARKTLRQLLYGLKPHVYRVIYEIDEPHRTVRVVTIRHPGRDAFVSG